MVVTGREGDKRILFLFTEEFPYGESEVFVKHELTRLAERFEKVIIFPLNKLPGQRALPSNVDVVYLFNRFDFNASSELKRAPLAFTKIMFSEYISTPHKKGFRSLIRRLANSLLQNFYRARVLSDYLASQDLRDVSFYSFWCADWATVLCILKDKGIIDSFVTRVHGFDLYENRWPGKVIPFRYFQLKMVKAIFPVSRDGLSYLRTHHPQFIEKFHLCHLAVPDRGINTFDPLAVFTLVSCASIIPLKRVQLISEALKHVEHTIRWIHFGGGPLKEQLEEQVAQLPPNISVELRGPVSNETLIKFYLEVPVHLFIHLSETEGGVSIVLQEAASFGIPLMATAVGGVPEIANEHTGISLPADVEAYTIACELQHFMTSPMNTQAFRENVRAYWKSNFGNEDNYSNFYSALTEA